MKQAFLILNICPNNYIAKMYFTAELVAKFGDVYKNLQAIVSIDQLPKTISEYNYVLSNLSKSDDSNGSHWIVSCNCFESYYYFY